jgi:hypothetical protein
MELWLQIVLAGLAGPVLWLAGAIFFDFVHLVLHAMLRSRWRVLRALAWPHAVHHEWIDRDLEVRWENQSRNIACHIVPEYGTQLVFTAALALWLPLPFIVVLAALQTAVFALILRQRGLDLNHRPIAMLDAYRPGFMTPPPYHALHHVHPDAYYSAYTKLVDVLAGSAAALRGRRFVVVRGVGPLAGALAQRLERVGVEDVALVDSVGDAALRSTDVLVLCEAPDDEEAVLESLIEATRTRKLPPEAWVVHARADEPLARHYLDDVRIHYRTLVVPALEALSQAEASAVARRIVSRIQRGCHYVSTASPLGSFGGRRRFRATRPEQPATGLLVRHRSELSSA